MPYIDEQSRDTIEVAINGFISETVDKCLPVSLQDLTEYLTGINKTGMTPGELNYILTTFCHAWIKQQGLNYANINTVMGVLESAKQEFYRTIVAPYEDNKRTKNGPVSELDLKV